MDQADCNVIFLDLCFQCLRSQIKKDIVNNKYTSKLHRIYILLCKSINK